MIVSVVGAGGHAKVVVAALEAAGHRVGGVFDDADDAQGREVLGARVLGPVDAVREAGAPVVIAIGSNEARRRIARSLEGAVAWFTVVHPHAWVHESARLGDGAVVCAGAVIQPDCSIGRHAIVNTGATVDHDCALGDFAHVAPGASLAGSVTVGEGAFLGTGARAIPGTSVGAWSTVAAGSVVVRDVPDGVAAAGVPARVVRGQR